MEGGFSKALLMKTVDGSSYIVKMPCLNAGKPMYCTASEVAVLDFGKILSNAGNTQASLFPYMVRKHITIPIPRVLTWSTDSTNPFGAKKS
ncbi:uncharacterized protein BDW47DRAFT_4627 [Aspergillus candidus]|uniref:Uncharacterized protein n=1 Tax=Aspergillus candidus TaxID=41067 RepID=A0A2I2FH88_ASPCN|nr:hypothetical protein BDW47DRAFT_4627 [Aspergillus candidus]PLB39970.1 hypothetical protein BDW47DRAFT_4627 [Aspergillus candidus]